MKRVCELCKGTATIHCESDQASLCWNCDAKVHSVNFLVARHSRNLLCRLCQSPTPWSAAGPKLEPTLSVCRKCAARSDRDGELAAPKEEEAEIHVVPWSPPPPPASESSFSGGEAAATRKRGRLENGRLTHDDLNICTAPPQKIGRRSPGVEGKRRFHREEAITGEEMPVDLNLNLSLSLFSR